MNMSRVETIGVDVEKAQEPNENVKKQETDFFTKLKNFVLRQILSIGTIFSVILGIFVPWPVVYLNERIPMSKVCVIVIFFFIGLRLRLEEAKSAIRSYKEIMVGLALGLFAAPVFGTSVLNMVDRFGPLIANASELNLTNVSNISNEVIDLPIFGPEEFRFGLQVICMSPCAPATTLILVTAANGHRGLSILVSILCTVVSVFTIPPMIAWLIPSSQQIDINVGKLLLNAVLIILMPMVIGRSLRFLKPVKKFITSWDSIIKYVEISSILVLNLVIVSIARDSGNLQKVSVISIVCVIALGTSFRTFNVMASYGFLSISPGFSKKSTMTLSLLTGVPLTGTVVAIVDALPDKAGDKGLMTLPVTFVYLTTLLTVSCFVTLTKVVDDDDAKNTKDKPQDVEADFNEDSRVESKINEVAAFTIYADEISIKHFETKPALTDSHAY